MINFFGEKSAKEEKFESCINYATMSFKDQKYEEKYQNNKVEAPHFAKFFKIGTAIVMILLVLRRIELFIFVQLGVNSISRGDITEYIMLPTLFGALIIETLFACWTYLNKLRGFVIMLYIYFMVAYTSRQYINIPASVPMYDLIICFYRALPMFEGAIVLGSFYVYTWIVAASAILLGVVIQVVFNHTYDYPICKLKTLKQNR